MVVKLLICGDVEGQFDLLLTRIQTLQTSSHGPFDVLFFTGRLFQNTEEFARIAPNLKFPLKAYAFDRTGIEDNILPPDCNLEFFHASGAGLATISGLTVAFLSHFPDLESLQDAKDITALPGYRGCDVLLTAEWPRETYHFLDDNDLETLRATGVGLGIGSQDVASFALAVRPRYHFAGSRDCFYQRPPYHNPPGEGANGAPQLSPCTRFVGLGRVSGSKAKDKKWLHALSLEPIVHMSIEEIVNVPAGLTVTDCPYVEVGAAVYGSRVQTSTTGHRPPPPPPPGGPMSKRPRLDDGVAMGPSVTSGSFFFGQKGTNRDGTGGSSFKPPPPNLIPPSATAKTLFIGGLSREVGEDEIRRSFPDVFLVRKPEGKSYAFVDFHSHLTAKQVVDASVKRPVSLGDRVVTIGWAKGNTITGGISDGTRDVEAPLAGITSATTSTAFKTEHPLDLTPPSADSKLLFVGGLSSAATVNSILAVLPGAVEVRKVTGKSFAFVEFQDFATADAIVKQSVNDLILLDGKALLIGWAKEPKEKGTENGSGGRHKGTSHVVITEPPDLDAKTLFIGGLAVTVTISDLEALFTDVQEIKRPTGRDYAFIEFHSPQAARRAMEDSGTGGMLVLQGNTLKLGWAKGRSAAPKQSNTTPPDCWFCLASPSVKVHLVLSVSEHAYVALPRGGLSDHHVLISPIDCVPSRSHLTAAAKHDFSKYERAVEDLFRSQQCAVLRFERTIRTQSRDHMQEHCVPIPFQLVPQALSIFLQQANLHHLKFSEISDNRDADEVVLTMEGGPYQEYFYIQIPMGDGSIGSSSVVRRFVYVHGQDDKSAENGNSSSSSSSSSSNGGDVVTSSTGAGSRREQRFPMQFGTIVAAHILGRPERVHWKNCVVSEAEEQTLSESFRTAFEPYDFTLK